MAKFRVLIVDKEYQSVLVESDNGENAKHKVSNAIYDGSLWESDNFQLEDVSESLWELTDEDAEEVEEIKHTHDFKEGLCLCGEAEENYSKNYPL